jgi:hypothetical protein
MSVFIFPLQLSNVRICLPPGDSCALSGDFLTKKNIAKGVTKLKQVVQRQQSRKGLS